MSICVSQFDRSLQKASRDFAFSFECLRLRSCLGNLFLIYHNLFPLGVGRWERKKAWEVGKRGSLGKGADLWVWEKITHIFVRGLRSFNSFWDSPKEVL